MASVSDPQQGRHRVDASSIIDGIWPMCRSGQSGVLNRMSRLSDTHEKWPVGDKSCTCKSRSNAYILYLLGRLFNRYLSVSSIGNSPRPGTYAAKF